MYKRNYGGFDYVRIHSELLTLVINSKFFAKLPVTDAYTQTVRQYLKNEKIEISDLSIRIRNKTNSSPTTDSLKDFDFEMDKIDIKEFIIYNFNNQNGTWLKDLILSTFQYWKELDYNDWKYILKNIDKNDLAVYYMNHISKVYLGIDPKFKSSKGIRERLFPKRYLQTEKSPDFLTTLNQDILQIELEKLNRNSINLDNLIDNSDKLIRQINKLNKNNIA